MPRTEHYTLAYGIPTGGWRNMLPDIVYLVLNDLESPFAFFLCPCGCSRQIMLPLSNWHTPNWTHQVHEDDLVSFNPSISLGNGCRSHFWLCSGRVEWCG